MSHTHGVLPRTHNRPIGSGREPTTHIALTHLATHQSWRDTKLVHGIGPSKTVYNHRALPQHPATCQNVIQNTKNHCNPNQNHIQNHIQTTNTQVSASFVPCVFLHDPSVSTDVTPPPHGSSNFGSPNGSVPDLDGMGARSCSTMEDEFNDIRSKLGQFDALNQWVSAHYFDDQLFGFFYDQLCRARAKPRCARRPHPCVGSGKRVRFSRFWFTLQEVGPCLVTVEDPPQLGPTTQLQWTIEGMDDRPNHQKVKTRAAQSSYDSRAAKIAQVSQPGFENTISVPEEEHEIKQPVGSHIFLPKPHANSMWSSTKKMACSFQLPVFFCDTTVTLKTCATC